MEIFKPAYGFATRANPLQRRGSLESIEGFGNILAPARLARGRRMNTMPSDPNSKQQGSSFPNLQSVSARSAPSSAYSASTAPAVPQISTSFHQYDSTPRPSTMSSSHSYSRSSPAANVDHKYTPFPNTPESSRYSSVSTSKHFIPQTPTGAPSQSPLALTDIRPPRTELHMGDDLASPSAAFLNEPSIAQTTSCYHAPWAVYAYDWCNWPIGDSSGMGKMAICSYLEDPHNFVSILNHFSSVERKRVHLQQYAARERGGMRTTRTWSNFEGLLCPWVVADICLGGGLQSIRQVTVAQTLNAIGSVPMYTEDSTNRDALTTDSNSRHPARASRVVRGMQPWIHAAGGSHLLLPCDEDIMGTAFFAKADHRPSCHFRRSSTIVVTPGCEWASTQ